VSTWPQYLFLGSWLLTAGSRLGLWLAKAPLAAPVPRGVELSGRLMSSAILAFVLWRGGFFAPIGWMP
jgi:hypothetical protein